MSPRLLTLEQKARKAAAEKAWYAANRERAVATRKAWREANRERVATSTKAWSKVNRKRVATCRRARARTAPLAHLWWNARRRAKTIGVSFTLPHWQDMTIEARCPYCHKDFVDGVGTGAPQAQSRSLDRIVPTLGYTPENTEQICNECNRTKSAFDVRTNTVGFAAWAAAVEERQRKILAVTERRSA